MENRTRIFSVNGMAAVFTILILMVLSACSSGTQGTVSPSGTQSSAVRLVFTAQPSAADAGGFFPSTVAVAAVDANGNVVSGVRRLVTLAVTDVPGNSPVTLFGGTTVTSAEGTFTFKELSVNRAGAWTLTASSEGLVSAVSNPFNINPGKGRSLVFSTKVVGGTAGAPFTVQPVVTVKDMYGNVSSGEAVDVTLVLNIITPESYEAVLSGARKIKTVNGVAKFTGLSINKAGTYVLTATSGSLGSAYSNDFEITPGAGVKLFFNTQPQTVSAGSPLTVIPPAIAVLVMDAYGNTASDSTVEVTLTITPGTGTGGATLSGVTKVKAVYGVASFEGLAIDMAGKGYTLTANAGGLSSAVSDSFDILPPEESSSSDNSSAP